MNRQYQDLECVLHLVQEYGLADSQMAIRYGLRMYQERKDYYVKMEKYTPPAAHQLAIDDVKDYYKGLHRGKL